MVTRINGTAKALVHQKILSQQQVDTLLELAESNQESLISCLFHHTNYDNKLITQACSDYFGFPIADTEHIQIPRIKHDIIYDDKKALIYSPDQLCDIEKTVDNISFITFSDYIKLQQRISKKSTAEISKQNSIQQLNHILSSAIEENASDIHFEPFEENYRIRFRIDGVLKQHNHIAHSIIENIVARIKVLANCDITQKRLPQDGRFTFTHYNQHCDCRTNICPTIWGEKIVIRLLESNQHILQFNELGLEPKQKEMLIETLNQPQGLILVTGPTGSGKTQTLYTAINYLNQINKNISTIEDPVEIKLNGINQININNKLGLSFSSALRALLRQDPDVIMIGEIRDQETAELAIRAAHTGHLVLSTLHTQNTIESITRLANMGISKHDITSTVKLIISQRLARQHKDNHYQGRVGVFEMLKLTPTINQHILNHATSDQLYQHAQSEGLQTLRQSGLNKIKQKITTQDELNRVIAF